MQSIPWLRPFGWMTVALVALVALAAACGDDETATPTATSPATTTATATGTAGGFSGDITVFAAASLTDAFDEAGEAFKLANPGVGVTFNYGSSSTLAVQINEAGGADIFASANNSQMKVVTDAGNANEPQQFASNILVVATPKDSTVVTSFEGIAGEGVKLVVAAPDVPVGQYAREAIKKANDSGDFGSDFEAKALANVVSEEADVKATLAKVQLGEADAGIVYATDTLVAADEVNSIPIEDEYNVVATYPIATTTDSENAELAQAWVDFILSPSGQAILAKYSFGPPVTS